MVNGRRTNRPTCACGVVLVKRRRCRDCKAPVCCGCVRYGRCRAHWRPIGRDRL
jgi:hypothetical protein